MTQGVSICLKAQSFYLINSCQDSQLHPELKASLEKSLQDSFQAVQDRTGLPSKNRRQKLDAAAWKPVQYGLGNKSSSAKITLSIPLEGAGNLRRNVEFIATLGDQGNIAWALKEQYEGDKTANAEISLYNAAADITPLQIAQLESFLQNSHMEYALLVPYLWGNGPQDQQTWFQTEKQLGEAAPKKIDQWVQDPLSSSSSPKDMIRILTHAFEDHVGSLAPDKQKEFLLKLGSILIHAPVEEDPYVYLTRPYWQNFTYGEVVYLRRLFETAVTPYQLDPNTGLGKLYQQNIDHLKTIAQLMQYDDDYEEGIARLDPELRSASLDNRQLRSGPIAPDLTPPELSFIDEQTEKVGQAIARELKETVVPAANDAASEIIATNLPKFESAIEQVMPKVKRLIGELARYLSDPKNTEAVRKAVQNILNDLIPILQNQLDAIAAYADAKLAEQLPLMKGKVLKIAKELSDQLAKDFTEKTYPEKIKPLVTTLIEQLNQLNLGGGPARSVQGTQTSTSVLLPGLPSGGPPREPSEFKIDPLPGQ